MKYMCPYFYVYLIYIILWRLSYKTILSRAYSLIAYNSFNYIIAYIAYNSLKYLLLPRACISFNYL